jgi:ocular albinism type 1 protein
MCFYRCHDIDTLSDALIHIFPNYCATFVPMAVIMVVNPILYCYSTRDVRLIISVRLGQYTQRERTAVDGIKTKFLFIITTFYICWLPNLICCVLIWSVWIDLPANVLVSLWYIMVSTYSNTSFVSFWMSCAHFCHCVIWKTVARQYLFWIVHKY